MKESGYSHKNRNDLMIFLSGFKGWVATGLQKR